MYIIIVGAGKVGYYLAKILISEGHEVMLIDKDKAKVARLQLELGESVMPGDGSIMEVLKEAGANRADVLVAVTGNDEDNLVICQMAKTIFIRPRTIARVNNPKNEDFFSVLGVDTTVSATKIIDSLIEEKVKAEDMIIPLLSLKEGDMEIVQVEISHSSPLLQKEIEDLSSLSGLVFVAIIRGKEIIAPQRYTKFQAEDEVICLVKKENMKTLHEMFQANQKGA